MAETRFVYVTPEYLDGIEMADVKIPDKYTGPTARRLPVEVLDAYDAAWAALHVAEEAVLKAWGEATDEPNPDHKDEEAEDAGQRSPKGKSDG